MHDGVNNKFDKRFYLGARIKMESWKFFQKLIIGGGGEWTQLFGALEYIAFLCVFLIRWRVVCFLGEA